MNYLTQQLSKQPARLSVLLTLISVGLLFVVKLFGPEPEPLVNLPRLFVLFAISLFVTQLLRHCQWTRSAGLTLPLRDWHKRWYLLTLPFLIVPTLNLLSANYSVMDFSLTRISSWLIANFATGYFEEVLMRGLCFFALVQVWGKHFKGLVAAAFFQALVFGFAHWVNLYHMPLLDVIAQVSYATLIGVGFAGLVYLSRSLWPAIILHTVINASASINDFLMIEPSNAPAMSIPQYVIVVILFSLVLALPGLLFLRAGFARAYKRQIMLHQQSAQDQ